MNDGENKEEKKEEPKTINPLLDQVKAERMALEKARDEAKSQADRLEKLRSEQLLSSPGGLNLDKPMTQEQKDLSKAQKLADEIVGAFRR